MLSLLHVLPLAVAAHASFTKLPSGNGWGTAVFDAAPGVARIVDLREHTYQSVDSGVATRDLVFDSYFGVRAAGQEAWLTGSPVESAALDGGVIVVKQHFAGVTATQYLFAPFGVGAPSLAMVLELANDTQAPIADVHAFTLHNVHVGDGDGTQGQRVDWDAPDQAFVQRSTTSQRVMLIRSLGAPAHHSVTPNNPYAIVQSGSLITSDTDSSGDANDVASGFQYDVGTLAPGQKVTVGVVMAYHPFGDVNALLAATGSWMGSSSAAALATAEAAQWHAWLTKAKLPDGLTSDEKLLYLQQLAVLRMAQSREPPDVGAGYLPTGQITASVRPGHWDIAWVRDACYAIAALARAGYPDEAKAGLEFMLRSQAGFYQQYVGHPYRLSVVRYLGKGKEESDSDANGPNIEFDGFGLFLWAASEYVAASGDASFVDTWWGTMSEGIADVLVELQESGGLLSPDSSIWETHWDNGGRRHYTFSDLWAVVGLERAAVWAGPRDGLRAMRYHDAAAAIRGAIASALVTPDGVLRADTEQPTTVDACVVEAFNQGVLDRGGRVAQATLAAMKQSLFLSATGHGYKRNQNGSAYDEREWIFIDLRTSLALRRAGQVSDGDALWGWVRDQALANHDLLPELYDQATADYAGETPMAGFGAGAYIVTAWDRAAPDVAGSDGGAPTDAGATDGGTKPPGGGGCGCAVGARDEAPLGSVALALAAIGVALASRRRTRKAKVER